MAKWKAVLPIVLAVLIALLGSFFTYRWAKRQIEPAPSSASGESQTLPIAVAAVDLSWGSQVTADKVRMVPYLRDSLPPGNFTSTASLEGRVVILPVSTGEPILESKLASADVTVGGVAAIIKPGYRALAVKGDKVIGMSGLVRPGNRVDVLVTYVDQRTDKEITKVVLQNILVLATGAEMVDKEKSREDTAPVDVYTLEVTPEDGETLSLAATQGKLHFALRNAMDTDTVLTKGAVINDALKSFSSVPVAPRRRAPAPPKGSSVEVIKGTNVTQENF